MRTHHVYLNGRIVPEEQAAISPLDIGLLRGYAVFDLLRTVNLRPFMLPQHLRRLRESAEQLGLTVPVSDDEIAVAIAELLGLNDHAEATVRMVLTGGVSPDGMDFDPATPTFFILTHELHEPPTETYELGATLLTCEHRREVPLAKTTNYLTMLKNRPLVASKNALDLLYHEKGRISEAASASFYLVRGNTILAPQRDVLWGTTGSLILDSVKEHYEVVFRELTLDDAFSSDEAFLTSTTRGVVPIVMLDDRRIGSGSVGPVTKQLIARYREALTKH